MARRPSKHLRPARPLSATLARAVAKTDGTWIVQNVTSQQATKPYLCPGCNRSLRTGEPHVVAWPQQASIGSASAVEERRHWHGACWARRR